MADDPVSWTAPEALEDFFQGAPCGLLVGSRDGLILAVNDTFLSWTGYERQALVGVRHFDDLLSLPCRIYHETHYAPLLQIQGFVHELALDIRERDGKVLPVLVNTVEKRGPDGAIELLRYAVFSAADRRGYERELLLERKSSEEAVKAKSDFLAMFAHEVRNPLAAVMLEIELLARTNARPDDEQSFVELRASLDRVLKLVSNMLEISKLEAGKAAVQKTEFEISDVVQAVVHTLRPLAAVRQLQLIVRVDKLLKRPVLGDPVKLEQALANLVGNAIKFTESGSVSIAAQRVAQHADSVRVRFDVVDTGIGIPGERHAHIFNEYEQADESIARRFGGTGLGLAITRKLVELQGGTLTLASEPGRGSSFSFELTFQAS